MSGTIFKKVDYDLGSLVSNVSLGRIGLPDIQRPFVWKNAKVRDLFDSMYKGYPVGYLLLWENGVAEASRAIGTDDKQLPPQLVIVDGQQRLTSLYAVIKGVPVLRKNFDRERIRIAFNPLDEEFKVTDAAIERDPTYIPDISQLWSDDTDVFEVVDGYLESLAAVRDVSAEEIRKVRKSITKLQGLLSYPFTALQLAADISVEDVSDVFVRINSKGKALNQADFILTLMSVFWDRGRADLEEFCRKAKTPSKRDASPFNYFMEPSPDQLLRVTVGVGFKRARLQYVYSILRGKDLDTGDFSDDRRVKQFDILKESQARTLNVQYWHDFLSCIRSAGFRGAKQISSANNLLFSYILYLIGRTEYAVDEFTLRKVIAQWFFMSAVTGRFTGSPESRMEFDMARFRDVTDPAEFVSKLRQICDITLTNDFWAVTLPNDLATSSPRSPSLLAYNAALVLMDAPALYSKTKLGELLDPALKGKREAVERHHLFPKGHLKDIGISGTRDTNQIANYAYVEYLDNLKISKQAPAEYVPLLEKRFSASELETMRRFHALPDNWTNMNYRDFLEARRELIADVIRQGYEVLVSGGDQQAVESAIDILEIIQGGESDAIEFKSTLRTNMHTGKLDPVMELMVLKTLAAYLNTNGGRLVIGVADDGTPVGVDADNFENEDKMGLHLVNIVKSRMGAQAMTLLHMNFDDYDKARVLIIEAERSKTPVFVKDGKQEQFFVRTGPATTELKPSETQAFISKRFA